MAFLHSRMRGAAKGGSRGVLRLCTAILDRRRYFACLLGFLLGSWLLGSCKAGASLYYEVSAMLYSDSPEEREYLEEYTLIYPNTALQLDLFEFRESYETQIQLLFETKQLPDIFSVWQSRAYRPMLESPELLDVRMAILPSEYTSDLFRRKYENGPFRMLPVRYNYSNVMLVNMQLLGSIKKLVTLDEIRHYPDFFELARLAKENRMNFLVVGDSEASGLGDLFFGPVAGWADSFWMPKYEQSVIDGFSAQLVNSVENFYSKFHDIFPNPYLSRLPRPEAEQMFLDGEVLLILGSTDQLFALSQKSKMPVEWLAFPSILPRMKEGESAGSWLASWKGGDRSREELRISKLSNRGALLGDVLGVAMPSRVLDYDMFSMREVVSLVQYYSGLNSRIQRAAKWGIPMPSLYKYGASALGGDEWTQKMTEFHNSIDYEYFRPSVYLSEEWNQFLDDSLWAFLSDDSWRFLEPEKRAALFLQNLLEFAASEGQPVAALQEEAEEEESEEAEQTEEEAEEE